MIQRIQSLLLTGVAILLSINLFVPIWTSNQTTLPLTLNAFSISYPTRTSVAEALPGNAPAQKNVYYIAALLIICIGLALYIILQYKNRLLQLRLCNLLMVLTLMIIGSYFIAIPAAKSMLIAPGNGNYEIGYFLPIVSIVLILASRYFIRKDEELVRSVDRIR